MELYRTDTCDKALLSPLSPPPRSIRRRILLKPFCFKGIRKRVGWSGAGGDGKGQRSVLVLKSCSRAAAKTLAEPGRALRPGDGWGRGVPVSTDGVFCPECFVPL